MLSSFQLAAALAADATGDGGGVTAAALLPHVVGNELAGRAGRLAPPFPRISIVLQNNNRGNLYGTVLKSYIS